MSLYIKLGRVRKLASAYSSLIQLGGLDERLASIIRRGVSKEELKKFTEEHEESSNPMLCVFLGDVYARGGIGKGQPEPSIQMYQRAIELSPNDPKIRATLGKYHFERKDYAEAVKAYAKAAELDPNQPFYQTHLAYSYNGLGEHEKAIELGRRLVEDVADSDAHTILGTIYINARRYEDAAAEYEGALALCEEHGKHSEFLLCALSTVYDELGRTKDADAIYAKTNAWRKCRGQLKSSFYQQFFTPSVRCSFCDRGRDDVQKLIAGGRDNVFICDECVDLCVIILRDEGVEC